MRFEWEHWLIGKNVLIQIQILMILRASFLFKNLTLVFNIEDAPSIYSSIGNTHLQDTLGQVITHCHQDKLIRQLLYVTWTGGPVAAFRLLHSVVVGSISSGGDYGLHCWLDPIRSKELFRVSHVGVCRIFWSW